MGLYIGSSKGKVKLNQHTFRVKLISSSPVTNNTLLRSSDDYILKTLDNYYLTAKREV